MEVTMKKKLLVMGLLFLGAINITKSVTQPAAKPAAQTAPKTDAKSGIKPIEFHPSKTEPTKEMFNKNLAQYQSLLSGQVKFINIDKTLVQVTLERAPNNDDMFGGLFVDLDKQPPGAVEKVCSNICTGLIIGKDLKWVYHSISMSKYAYSCLCRRADVKPIPTWHGNVKRFEWKSTTKVVSLSAVSLAANAKDKDECTKQCSDVGQNWTWSGQSEDQEFLGDIENTCTCVNKVNEKKSVQVGSSAALKSYTDHIAKLKAELAKTTDVKKKATLEKAIKDTEIIIKSVEKVDKDAKAEVAQVQKEVNMTPKEKQINDAKKGIAGLEKKITESKAKLNDPKTKELAAAEIKIFTDSINHLKTFLK
jgi:hypothetical protein